MRTLQLMFEHHAWANRRLLDTLETVAGSLLSADAKGTSGSIEQTIKHLVGVEDTYLAFIQGKDLSGFRSQEAYFGQSSEWFRQRLAALGPAYLALLASTDGGLLERPLVIPWIDAPLTVRDGLIQVLTHSAQHRAQILSTLGDRGQKVPDMDYVLMRLEGQAPPEAGPAAKV